MRDIIRAVGDHRRPFKRCEALVVIVLVYVFMPLFVWCVCVCVYEWSRMSHDRGTLVYDVSPSLGRNVIAYTDKTR